LEAIWRLKERGIRYYRSDVKYNNLNSMGMIKLGKIHFTHGFAAGVNATRTHLAKVRDNIVHGHTHAMAEVIEGSAARPSYGAWSCGCLCQRSMLYHNTTPSNATHGYGIELINASTQTFLHLNIPIIPNHSLLEPLMNGSMSKRKDI
jgi:hypothetical protein